MKSIPIRSIQANDRSHSSFNSFKIRKIEDVLGGKEMHQELHRHDFYFLLILRKGAGVHVIDFVEHVIVNGSVFFMRPGQVHKLKLEVGSDGFLVEFSRDFQLSSAAGAAFLRKATNKSHCKLSDDNLARLHAISNTIWEEYTLKDENYQDVIKSSLEVLFIQFLRARNNASKDLPTENSYRQEKLEEFQDLLEKHIKKIKQVAAYADMLNLSPFQLNSTTKSLLGKTATEVIEEQIILEAKRNLLATSNQINQIADHLGYDDVSYFIRFFKKHTGYSPESYRQNFH